MWAEPALAAWTRRASWRKGCGAGQQGAQHPAGEALWAEWGKKGPGLGRSGARPGRGRTSKVSTQPPDGVSWRGWGKGPLPATLAILGPESNQIRRSPQSPQQLRRTAVRPPRARGGWDRASCPPPSLHCPRVWAAREPLRGQDRALGPRQKPGPPPNPCCATVAAEIGHSVLLSAHSLLGKPLSRSKPCLPEQAPTQPHPQSLQKLSVCLLMRWAFPSEPLSSITALLSLAFASEFFGHLFGEHLFLRLRNQ